MRQYTSDNLLVRPGVSADPDVLVEVHPEQAGWDTIHFQARRLSAGHSWSFATHNNELALVLLGGSVNVESSRGRWTGVGGRPDVFKGLPHALYLPRDTTFTVSAVTDSEFAAAWVSTDQDYPARLVTPADVSTELRGADNASRQINSILPPGFPCARLVVVEVYTPGGNWSSYPPHKHDIHKVNTAGQVVEADLDEIYYYKLDRPEGYAFQRVYTDPESPLHRAGFPIDATVMAQNNSIVLIPEGYHPVASPPGYTTYYLNVLAGSAQSLANSDDPRYAWVKDSFRERDPRVPIYPLS
ncbi:MAG TPA: 5-deoxy-glucuronate isomerase [Aggregatilineales bacterium]|nr:5-deoxy-glucuronate isomerase [Aggregatilineales bacterium]